MGPSTLNMALRAPRARYSQIEYSAIFGFPAACLASSSMGPYDMTFALQWCTHVGRRPSSRRSRFVGRLP